MNDFEKLKVLGINYSLGSNSKITAVRIPLSPEQWYSLLVRNGGCYIGGCCGNLSFVQDVLMKIFRDGGWINSFDFYEIAEILTEHEGFEDFKSITNKHGKKIIDNWGSNEPMAQIAYVWSLVKDNLEFGENNKFLLEQLNISSFEENENIVTNTFYAKRIAWLMNVENRHDDRFTVISLAKIYPIVKNFFVEIEKKYKGFIFDGFAIFCGDNIFYDTNGQLCVFENEKQLYSKIDEWKSHGMIKNNFIIKKIRITLEKGLEVIEEIR